MPGRKLPRRKSIVYSPALNGENIPKENSRPKEYRKEKIMSIFSIALFLHIVGALGVSVALGLEWIGLSQISKATIPDEIRAILRVVKSTTRFGFVSMFSTVITGIYMVLTALGWIPWILVVIGALILVIALTRVLTAPRMATMGQALATEKGLVSQTFYNLVNDPILWISIQTRVTIILGIVFLKIGKPDLDGSLLTIGIAIVLGIVSALPTLRLVRAREGSMN
jgi:protein-S-isoprenylcysteine O-methyltransferase Ste14